MSSDLFLLDDPFFSDQFSTFPDSPIELLQAISDHHNHQIIPQNPVQETSYSSSDQIPFPIFSTSPPSHQLENLSLYQTTQFPDFSSSMEVKTEECRLFAPYRFEAFGHGNAAARMMQRSFSSHSFDGKPSAGFSFQPRLDCVVEGPHFQGQAMSDPENGFSVGSQIRRVHSAGDLHKTTQANHRLSSSPLATEGSFIDEANLKVGRYSAEERKERIHRYRAKRTQRNFNKTIKYACRKTLADNRPRIRGRFARNDETGEFPKAANFNRYEDEDDLWIDGYNEEEEERSLVGGGGPLFNILGPTQIQYYGY